MLNDTRNSAGWTVDHRTLLVKLSKRFHHTGPPWAQRKKKYTFSVYFQKSRTRVSTKSRKSTVSLPRPKLPKWSIFKAVLWALSRGFRGMANQTYWTCPLTSYEGNHLCKFSLALFSESIKRSQHHKLRIYLIIQAPDGHYMSSAHQMNVRVEHVSLDAVYRTVVYVPPPNVFAICKCVIVF